MVELIKNSQICKNAQKPLAFLVNNAIITLVNSKQQVYKMKKLKCEPRKGGITMKVTNIKNIEGFFKIVDSCKGKVELVTGEGDRLNLKSKLCQYVSMASIFSNGSIPELELIAYEREDIDALINFMLNGN